MTWSRAGWLWLLLVAALAAAVAAVALAISGRRRDAGGAQRRMLAERLARGEIDDSEFRTRLTALGERTPARPGGSGSRWRRVPVVVGAVAVALAAAAVAVAAIGPSSPGRPAGGGQPGPPPRACTPPPPAGRLVEVALTDMGAMMRGPMMRGPGWTGMRVLLTPTAVPAGQVSLRVTNTGSMVHELLVLPLAPGGTVGTRPVGTDGTVSEDGSLGEASKTCGTGQGDGIAAGTTGWATLTLIPGRYELICNLPGHYAAGMYAELDVR